ncbi:MAG: DeoR/GlpR transcriptional regulator [Clostridia bacterium]|nr:DeoR/GlpR transcriptional regulator [Clostridia bacterium]
MPEERRREINAYLQSRGMATLAELTERFPGVSGMTIRRDLEKLERDGELVRIRGGARSLANLSLIREAAYTQRSAENHDAKSVIAEKAVRLVTPGHSLYIDAGTTCTAFAKRLETENLFVLTPAPNVALELARNPDVTVMMTGGQLNRDTFMLTGFNAVEYVKTLNIQVAFMGASAFSVRDGFTCGYFAEAELKKLIVKKAQKVVILMDSSKFGRCLPYTFARAAAVDVLVTDSVPDAASLEALTRARVDLP